MDKNKIDAIACLFSKKGYVIIKSENVMTEFVVRFKEDIENGKILWERIPELCLFYIPDKEEAFRSAKIKINGVTKSATSTKQSIKEITFFTDQYWRNFACVMHSNGSIANYPLYSKIFRGIAALQVMTQNDRFGNTKFPTSENINTYLAQCEAQIYLTGLTHEIYNRAAKFDEHYFIDVCDKYWRVICFDKNGWELLDNQPFPMFMRYNHQQDITIAEYGSRASFDKFIELLHVSETYKLQIETYVILTGLADIQQVILYMIGSQGSVKSTAEELISSVFDPTITETLTLPHQQKELVQQLMHHYIPVYDNIDFISDDIASDLCRACTGAGFEKRQLYSDDDDVIYRYRRKVMLNGINIANQRPDFIERCLIIVQERVSSIKRKSKEDVVREAKQLLPEVRAYCLDILVRAINEYDTVSKELLGKLPRMADYCIWAECAARALGYAPLEFYNSYVSLQDKQTIDALLSDVVGELTLAWLERSSEWQFNAAVEVNAGQLYNNLIAIAEERKYNPKQMRFPGSPTWLTNRLNNLKHSFAEYGIILDTSIRKHDANLYRFTKSSANSTSPQARLCVDKTLDEYTYTKSESAQSTDSEASGTNGAISNSNKDASIL